MEQTESFAQGKIPFAELLEEYQRLLVNEDPKFKAEFDKSLAQHHAVLLDAIFAQGLLGKSPALEERELQTVICIIIAEFCKTLTLDELEIIPAKVFDLLANSPPHIARLYSSMVQSYARVLSTSSEEFQQLPPVEMMLLQIEGESELIPYLLEALATCAIFDGVKVLLIAQHGIQRMAARLAASENADEVCGILGLIHSTCFNLTDVIGEGAENGRASVYDVVAPAVREIQLSLLLDAVLEKEFGGQTDVNFNVLMVLHGCLLPHTRELAVLRWAQFAAEQIDIKREVTVQVACETIVKIIAIAEKEERSAIADYIADNAEFVRRLFALLEVSSNFQMCGIAITLFQVVAAHCTVRGSYQAYPFGTLPILHYTHRLARQLAKNPLETIVSQLENSYQAMLYFTESRCPQQWPEIAAAAEARSVLYLSQSLSAVSGLLSELRGVIGVVGVLCGYDAFLYGVEQDLKAKPGEFEKLLAFLFDLCLEVKRTQQERGYIVIVSILRGISRYKEHIRRLDPHVFAQLIECFRIELAQEFDDVLMDIVEGFGDACPQEIVAEIERLLSDLGGN